MLLRAYIGEWNRFFEQAAILPMPFHNIKMRKGARVVSSTFPSLLYSFRSSASHLKHADVEPCYNDEYEQQYFSERRQHSA